MTNIALCYSGSTRTFQYCVKNHSRVFEKCDVFISTWDKTQRVTKINDPLHRIIDDDIPENVTENYITDLIPKHFNLVDLKIQSYDDSLIRNNNAINKEGLSFQYYKLKDCFNLLKKSKKTYDFIVRIRMDITIENCFFEDDKICISDLVHHKLPFKHGNQKMLNEMIWTCNQELHEKTVSIYDNLDKLNARHGEGISYENFALEGLIEKVSPKNFDWRVIR